jgi:hypothetical protein
MSWSCLLTSKIYRSVSISLRYFDSIYHNFVSFYLFFGRGWNANGNVNHTVELLSCRRQARRYGTGPAAYDLALAF